MKSIHITRKQLLTGLALLSGLIVLIVCGTLWYLIATAPRSGYDLSLSIRIRYLYLRFQRQLRAPPHFCHLQPGSRHAR